MRLVFTYFRNFFLVVSCHIFDTEFVAFIDLLILATIKTVHDNVTLLADMRLDVGSNLFSRLGLHLVTRGFS